MTKTDTDHRNGAYIQLFVYRVPKKNREALQKLLEDIVNKLIEHGTLSSEFYRLYSTEAFQGFMPIASAFAALPEEEFWVELDHYKSRDHRDQVMSDLSKDANAGALFRQLGPLVSYGYKIVMGEFESMPLTNQMPT
jgi:uncharacterized protein YbaA (DUF1428 family)